MSMLLPLLLGASAAMPAPQTTEQIIITASRLPQRLGELPVNISVLTRDDIARSPASTVGELLASVAGVNVRGDGSGEATIDLRGFGATGASNTQILLDGVKLNDDDMSAPRLSGIALDSIERIEIVRGGALAYGGGASGGVINLITRHTVKGGRAALLAQYGSYARRELNLHAEQGGSEGWLRLQARGFASNGYRINSARDGRSFELSGGAAGWTLVYGREQEDRRFPGVRKVTPTLNQYRDDPQGTDTPNNYGWLEGGRWTLHGEGSSGALRWSLDASRRNKEVFGYFDYSTPGFPYTEADRRQTQTDRISPTLGWRHGWFGANSELLLGFDVQQSHTDRFAGSAEPAQIPAGDSTVHNRALWLEQSFQPMAGSRFTLGARSEQSRQSVSKLSSWAAPSHLASKDRPTAWQLAFRQQLHGDWDAFARLGSSYRLANADELVDGQLKPQRSRDFEFGIDGRHGDWRSRLALYRLELRNEIHYQPYQGFSPDFGGYQIGKNINLDPTRRQGLELGLNGELGDWSLAGQISLQQARFTAGSYDQKGTKLPLAGKTVPLAPKLQAHLDLGWQFSEASRVALAIHHTGKARMDNDQPNEGVQLEAYSTLDLKLSHHSDSWDWSLTGQNLSNKRYASYGVRSADTTARYNLYPAAGRRWLLNAKLGF